jgi:hypothetical protein
VIQNAGYRELQFIRVQRLCKIVPGSFLQGLHRCFHRGVSGHHHHRKVLKALLDLPKHLQTPLAGHSHVEKDESEGVFAQAAQRFLASGGGRDFIPFLLEDRLQHGPVAGVVIHHKKLLARPSGFTHYLLLCRKEAL